MPDGHTTGNLNFVATRHGWSRNFTLAPDAVAAMSYATLENLLELNTLKLRALSLKIFVEHPPASGTFVKIRPWKDDGTLQAILMHDFFEERMKAGVTTALDIRDGNIRDDGTAEGKEGGGVGAKEWLKAHGLTRTKSSAEEEEAGSEVAAETKSQQGGFLSAFGFGKPPSVPTKDDATEGAEGTQGEEAAKKAEEEVLRERGWGPPIVRRLTSRKPRKPKAPYVEKDILAEGDGEEIEIPEAEEANGGTRPERNAIWRKPTNAFLSGKKGKKEKEVVKPPADTAAAPAA